MNWNERYLNLAEHISTWSKDPSTKIGAVIIGEQAKLLVKVLMVFHVGF